MTISLPAPSHEALIITVSDTGQLVGFRWKEAADLNDAQKDAIIANDRGRMFSGVGLCLTSLVALFVELETLHETACTEGSRYQEKYGFCDTADSLKIDADIVAASAAGLRARAWVANYPAHDAKTLSAKILALVDGAKLSSGLMFPERLALRADALRIS